MSERKPRQRHAKNPEIGDWTQFLPAPAQQNPIADEEVEFRQAVSARLDILRAAKLENLAREFQRLRDVFLGPETQRQRVRTRAAATTIILGLAQNGWERAILEYPKNRQICQGQPRPKCSRRRPTFDRVRYVQAMEAGKHAAGFCDLVARQYRGRRGK